MGHPDEPSAETVQASELDRIADAHDANAQEHDLTLFQALSLYPTGVFWSIVMSTAVVMEGYDTKLIGTLFAQPTFQQAFGRETSPGSFQITAPWQTGLSNGSSAGQLLGLLVAGHVSEQFGFRKTMIVGLAGVVGLIFITFFAPSLAVLEVGQVLFGKQFPTPFDLHLLRTHSGSRNPPGHLSDNPRRVCPRDIAALPACLPDQLRQLLLGTS